MAQMKRNRPGSQLCRFLYFYWGSLSLLWVQAQSRLHERSSDEVALEFASALEFTSKTSQMIPSLDDTIEMGRFSDLIYSFKSQRAHNCSDFDSIFHSYNSNTRHYFPSPIDNSTYTCHFFNRNEQDTQVLIVSRTHANPELEYIAIIYAGTDDFRNALTDTNIRTQVFGPQGTDGEDVEPFVSSDIRVHAGFNNAVFSHGLYDAVRDTVLEVKRRTPHLRILTTGHSLGAADAILTAVALKVELANSTEPIVSVNFGCPKTGNGAWRAFVNSLPGLGIWRVVRGVDLIPRMPGVRFHHVGHTVQLDRKEAGAYWLHNGDHDLGYRGVPLGWNAEAYALAPAAAYEHLIGHYSKYLSHKSLKNPEKYYINRFEAFRHGDHDESDDDDGPDESDGDYYIPPIQGEVDEPVGDLEELVKEYGEQYLKYLELERAEEASAFRTDASLQIL